MTVETGRPSRPASRRVGVYPGSFNPPTVAHLAIAEAAREQRHLDRVVLVLSRKALAKEHVEHPRFEHRLAVVESSVRDHAWLSVAVTDRQLLVEIADGHDVLIMGADKWAQINEPSWYGGSHGARDEALNRLPELAIAPRPPIEVPDHHALRIPSFHHTVSSTLARSGSLHLMTQAARDFAERTGAWIDVERYQRTITD